ncbi:hypothetical protein FRC02_001679 [Tulasnella sp. 418]|nr:hypothetical protein FRC02_001679 [Tulasnella sp. 418]
MVRKTEYLQEGAKVDDDGCAYAMARDVSSLQHVPVSDIKDEYSGSAAIKPVPIDCRGSDSSTSLIPAFHSVPLLVILIRLSSRDKRCHKRLFIRQHIPIPLLYPGLFSLDNLPIHRHTTTSNIPNQPVS